jgi:hypothetical protein
MPKRKALRCSSPCNHFEGCGVGSECTLDVDDVDLRLEDDPDDLDDSDG